MLIYRVIKQFKKHKIPYALIGGYAVALHGAVRGTVDVDFITKWELKNLNNIQRALAEIGLSPRLPIKTEDLYHFKNDYIQNRHLIAWNFINPSDPTEQVDIIITDDLINKKIKKIKVDSCVINLLSLKDLIKMKKKSGRPQDLIDVHALEKLNEE